MQILAFSVVANLFTGDGACFETETGISVNVNFTDSRFQWNRLWILFFLQRPLINLMNRAIQPLEPGNFVSVLVQEVDTTPEADPALFFSLFNDAYDSYADVVLNTRLKVAFSEILVTFHCSSWSNEYLTETRGVVVQKRGVGKWACANPKGHWQECRNKHRWQETSWGSELCKLLQGELIFFKMTNTWILGIYSIFRYWLTENRLTSPITGSETRPCQLTSCTVTLTYSEVSVLNISPFAVEKVGSRTVEIFVKFGIVMQ